MVIVKAKATVGLLDGLQYFGMAIAERVCRPAVLKVDVAFTVQVPDKVARRFVDDNLTYCTETPAPGEDTTGEGPVGVDTIPAPALPAEEPDTAPEN